MLQPYKIIEESKVSTTYQYNTLYSWALLVILVFMIVSMYLNNAGLQLISAALIIFYLGSKLILGRNVTNKIKEALKSGSVEVSGGKYSFSKPIKVKIPKNA